MVIGYVPTQNDGRTWRNCGENCVTRLDAYLEGSVTQHGGCT